jgi:hypothetical protein
MAKDIIFNGTKRTERRLCLPPSYFDIVPVIDLVNYTKLMPETVVEVGDEYFVLGRWRPVLSYSAGGKAGNRVVYRRLLNQEI